MEIRNDRRSVEVKKVSSHYWLRNPGDKVFHSYLIAKSGAHSVCEGGRPLSSLRAMDIPGDRSVCCNDCFLGLYGVDLRAMVVGSMASPVGGFIGLGIGG